MRTQSRRRSREQLINDALVTVGSPLSFGSKYALLDNICWTLSELDGKYDGCRWWSRNALAMRHAAPRELRHEHVVPRRVIISLVLQADPPDEDRIRAVLQLCIGAVVTKAEDDRLNAAGYRSRMPPDWDYDDPFARYRRVGIELVDTARVGTPD